MCTVSVKKISKKKFEKTLDFCSKSLYNKDVG